MSLPLPPSGSCLLEPLPRSIWTQCNVAAGTVPKTTQLLTRSLPLPKHGGHENKGCQGENSGMKGQALWPPAVITTPGGIRALPRRGWTILPTPELACLCNGTCAGQVESHPAWGFCSTPTLSHFQSLPCRPSLWVPCGCHMIGSQNVTFPTLFRVAPTQPGHGKHRRFLSMLFLLPVPQTKKNQDSHFWGEVLENPWDPAGDPV